MSAPAPSSGRRVAIVNRMADTAGQALSGFLAQLALDPLVVGNISGDASTDWLEPARMADFAFVLTPSEDLANAETRTQTLIEIGFLLGAIPRGRLCFLLSGKAELPPELALVPRHGMDDAGLWRLLVAREMRQAGLDVDMNRAL
jgi:hypothetical protein